MRKTTHHFNEARSKPIFWNDFKDLGGTLICRSIIELETQAFVIITKAKCTGSRRIECMLYTGAGTSEVFKVLADGNFVPNMSAKVLDAGGLFLPKEKSAVWDDFLKDHHQRIVFDFVARKKQNPERYKIVQYIERSV